MKLIFLLFYTGDTCEIDIDECASNPCQHDAECIQGIATFTCNCKPGYTGTNCETNIDECEVSWRIKYVDNFVFWNANSIAGLELGNWNWGCHLLHRMSSAGAK